MFHCYTAASWYAIMSSSFNDIYIFSLVGLSAMLYELLIKPILLISRAIHTCFATFMSNMILFLLVWTPFDTIWNALLHLVSRRSDIRSIDMSSRCFRYLSTSSDESIKAIFSSGINDCDTRLDLYDLYDIGMALMVSLVDSIRR